LAGLEDSTRPTPPSVQLILPQALKQASILGLLMAEVVPMAVFFKI
jgi:TRAP-type C4-dicarboxylate transport system permease large subunit